MCYGPEQQQHLPVFLQSGDLLGGKWQGWNSNLSLIIIPGFMNLPNKLILTFEYYNIGLQSHRRVFWVSTATKLVNAPPKWGLV